MIKIYVLIIFLFAVFVHELAHFIVYKTIVKKNPSVKFAFWGIQIGNEKEIGELTPKQHGFMAGAGIVIGIIPLILIPQITIILVYCLMCMIDFTILIQYYGLEEKFQNVKLKNLKLVIVDS